MNILKFFKKQNKKWYTGFLTKNRLKWQKIGTEYGGWYIPEGFLSENSVCYCLGAGEDVSFDLGLINRFKCAVVSVDPTPRALKHYEKIIENTGKNRSTPILSGNISEVYYMVNPEIFNRWTFLPYGVWKENTVAKFYVPKNPEHVSHSLVNLQQTSEYFEAECKTLKSIMEEQSHSVINLLKMDIEGAEHDVTRSVLAGSIKPEILLLEYDQPCTKEKMAGTTEFIINNGYSLVKVDGNNFVFLLNFKE